MAEPTSAAYRISNWTLANLARMRCPKCGEQDIPNARPTLEQEQDGSLSCRTCAHNWKPERNV